jgi:hypothetical protein
VADFSKLPVGTMMVVKRNYCDRYLRPVERVLKKYIVCGGSKWSIDGFNHLINADRWSMATIKVATPEDITAIRHAERAEYLRALPWLRLPAEVVERICTEASAEVGKLLEKEKPK